MELLAALQRMGIVANQDVGGSSPPVSTRNTRPRKV